MSSQTISVISHIPKIIERFVGNSLDKYFSDNSLLIEDQFAYIKHQSTVNALHTLIDNTLCNINDGLITGIVQLDLRKGFDTINHYILLYKLEKYDINDNCLSWFKSYLSNRQQVVSCNGELSKFCSLSIGVPQGTILGPTLFVIYINDFSLDLGPVSVIRYADDTTIIACDKTLNEVQLKLQSSVDNALVWLNNNRLLVNSSKSKCMLIGTRQRLANSSLLIHINGTFLENCEYTKLLGLYIDSNLTWNKHVDFLCKKLSKKLGILYRYSKILPKYTLHIIYNTLIQPDIDYAISLWGHCAILYFNKIQRLQNRCGRIICNNFDWSVSSNILLNELGIMTLKVRKDYFIGMLMFKTLHDSGLSYLLPQLKFTNEYHNYNTRAANNNLLVQNKPNCELFKTCMQYYGSQLWNSLPPHLKTIDDVNQFKHDYKQHLHILCSSIETNSS